MPLLLIVVGAHLLLPGLCTIIVLGGRLSDPYLGPIPAITFAIGFVGVVLIVVGFVRR